MSSIFCREWFTEFLKECPTGELTKKKVRQRHSFFNFFKVQMFSAHFTGSSGFKVEKMDLVILYST
jgi:hypothetical protein